MHKRSLGNTWDQNRVDFDYKTRVWRGGRIFLGQWLAYHVGFGSVCDTVCVWDVGRGRSGGLTDNPGQFSGEKEIKAAKNK